MQDIRHAIRTLVRARGFALVSLLVLAIGIGANAAIISLVDGVLRAPLPYPDADRLVRVSGIFTRLPLRMTETGLELAYPARVPELLEARSLASAGQYAVADVNLGHDKPERVRIAAVTPGFFAAMGVRPLLGRTFTDGDVSNIGQVVVVSFRLWTRRFEGDRSIVGRLVELNGRSFQVSGVMPRGVDLPDAVDLWIPSTADSQIASVIAVPAFLARLAPGVRAATAQAEVLRLTRNGALTAQDSLAPTLRVMPIREALVDEMRPTLLLVAAAGLLGLLVACINTGSLVLVHLSARQTEFAIRRALGASTSRLIRQVLSETLILTVAAILLAVPLSQWTLSACTAAMPDNLRGVTAASVDGRILGALASLCFCIAAGFAILPTLVSPHSVNSALRRSSTPTRDSIWRHLRAALVVLEIAGAVSLLAGGATLVHTLRALATVDMGVHSADAVVAKVTLPRARYSSSDEIRLFYDRIMSELVSVPGVRLVGATSHLPGSLTDMGPSVAMSIEGKAALTDVASPYALRVSVTPRYFAAIGIDVAAGRSFSDEDRAGGELVAVISERFATGFRMEPRHALGRRVNIGLGEEKWAVIVGVVKDVRAAGPESDWQPAVYVPVSQAALNATGYLVIDSGPRPTILVPAIREAVRRVDPTVPLYSVSTISAVHSEYLSTRRFAMMTIAAFGSVGFGLAVLGLYSVVSYSVQLRTQEIAIRMALGAAAADVRRQVMGSGLRQAAAGLALGIALAIALWRLTSSFIHGLGPLRAIDIVVLSSVVLFVSLIATWIPSERAVSIDPWLALRN